MVTQSSAVPLAMNAGTVVVLVCHPEPGSAEGHADCCMENDNSAALGRSQHPQEKDLTQYGFWSGAGQA